jgi:hypothetical protein
MLLIALIVGLFFGLIVLFEIGRRIGMRQMSRDPEGAHTGVAGVESFVFGLMGLLIGFTFFGAAQRFDYRRNVVVDETNRIRTAYFRLDLLPSEKQPNIRRLFREYLDSRIEFYQSLTNEADARESVRTKELQRRIWQEVVNAAASPGVHPNIGLLLPSLNEMIEITNTRTLAMQIHPPAIVYAMLIGLNLATALLAGYQMAKAKRRNWVHVVGFAVVLSLVVYVILDMEYPRMGLIRMTSMDAAMVNLRDSIQ